MRTTRRSALFSPLLLSAAAARPASAQGVIARLPRRETRILENPEGTIRNAGWFNIWAINAGGQSTGLHQLAMDTLWYIDPERGIDGKAWVLAYTAWRMDPNSAIGEVPPEGHFVWDIWAAYEEMQKTADLEQQKQVFWKILDIWAEEVPCPGMYGGFPYLVVVKNGFKGIQEGYGWDCCTTIYEYVIDNATWYWDEPEKHTT